MNLSYKWLLSCFNSDVNLGLDLLSDSLVSIGFEIESIVEYSKVYNNVLVGYVTETKVHQDANKLNICIVRVGGDEFQIVCGASNVRPGIKVPVAMIGSKLPNGVTISSVNLRGVDSHGMICSAEELGISSEHDGIMELPEWVVCGNSFANEYFDDDIILDIAVPPNRGDCQGVIGIAREISALLDIAVINNPFSGLPNINTSGLRGKLSVSLKVSGSIFCGIEVANVNNIRPCKEISQRLNAVGIKSHSMIIDISNYVMFFTGIPIHMYDKDKIGNNITLSFGTDDGTEEFLCINGSEEVLSSKTVVVRDEINGPISILGVMGGANSMISNSTKNVLIECGYIPAPLVMVGCSGIKAISDARFRSERGVDIGNIKHNALFSLSLLQKFCDGKVVDYIYQDDTDFSPIKIFYSFANFCKIIGISPDTDRSIGFLTRLGFDCVDKSDDVAARSVHSVKNSDGYESDTILELTVPSHRHDIRIQEDVTEEIVRMCGIDNIPEQPLVHIYNSESCNTTEFDVLYSMKSFLSYHGYREVINYMLVESDLLSHFGSVNNDLGISNPMNRLNAIHSCSLLNLLKNIKYNIDRYDTLGVCLMESTNVFSDCDSYTSVLSGVRFGFKEVLDNSSITKKCFDIFDVKSDICSLLQRLYRYFPHQIDIGTELAELPYGHPYRCYSIKLNGELIGYFGEVNPILLLNVFNIKGEVLFFEIYPDNIRVQRSNASLCSSTFCHKKEICFTVAKSVRCGEILDIIEKSSNYITKVSVCDVFVNDGEFGAENQSVNISFSLTDCKEFTKEEVQKIFIDIVNAVESGVSGSLRGDINFD